MTDMKFLFVDVGDGYKTKTELPDAEYVVYRTRVSVVNGEATTHIYVRKMTHLEEAAEKDEVEGAQR